jgi:diaminohydroxyphosphoribosylaminopyrimidine deaminase/5-amino-6-(5-phosphoribosylamino)uracil reductase
MRRALDLAALGRGLAAPNPMVGAVLVRDGVVVGEGWHAGPGTHHAEVAALEAAGEAARGATLICTLEPCDHHGRTPPCTDALIRAGIARAVIAATDPNPVVDGRGIARLRHAGIAVETGTLEAEARRLNRGFERHVVTGLPFVTLKLAASLDGKTAAADGTSKWITGQEARADVHRLRAGADAILVGAGTVLADDPALTVRDPAFGGRPPLRVIADARGRVPADRTVFDDAAPSLVVTTDLAPPDRIAAWSDRGAEVVVVEASPAGVLVTRLVETLGKRDVQSLLVEGGATLAWSLVEARLVDSIVLYLAPLLVGGATAPGVVGGAGFAPIGGAAPVDVVDVTALGRDLRVEADVHRDR